MRSNFQDRVGIETTRYESNVPNTTESTFDASSNVSPPFMRTPDLAPTPVPTITAVGVASPKAHGQDITKHEIPNKSEKVCGDSSSGRKLSGTIPV